MFLLGDVNIHLEDHGRAVHVRKGKIVRIHDGFSVGGGALPVVGLAGFKRLERFTEAAGLGKPKAIVIAVSALRLAEFFLERAVGKGNVVVGRQ